MSEPTTILTAAEVEALQNEWPVFEQATHWDGCEKSHVHCAIARLAASHLALWRENEQLRQNQRREPEDWETVCYECEGSGWRARA